MSLILSFGYRKPQDGDKGSTFWDDLEDDIQQLNDHSHNGTNSAKLSANATNSISADVFAANWVANGYTYRQLLTVPTGMAYDNLNVIFRDAATARRQAFLQTEKVSATQYYVYCNDNTKSFKAVYSS